ncbi:hypothetical protein B0919_14385 [Hymenobacter sp. CRA2]|nr:hypothetical protein B0919_14385 [Hymenobacter sp. CRA2]
MGLMTFQAQAQQKNTTKKSSDGWGDSGWDTPAPKKATKAAAPAKAATAKSQAEASPAPTEQPAATPQDAAAQSQGGQASGVGSAGAGGFGGGSDGAAGGGSSSSSIQGMSVAPGSALRPMGRTRFDYRGRPIEQKPSMRPRTQRN